MGAANWPIIGQIATLLGHLMDWIFTGLSAIGIENIGISIIVFTIIIYMLMLPLTIRQQKSAKMQAIMAPEIQAIQKKYAGKKDQATMAKQQEEMQVVYTKYGSNPMGSCLPMLIQMPILFALFPVVQNIPRYVTGVGEIFKEVANKIVAQPGYLDVLNSIKEGSANIRFMGTDYSNTPEGIQTIASALYRYQENNWQYLMQQLPALDGMINDKIDTIHSLNSFLGINIGETPWNSLQLAMSNGAFGGILLAIMIPAVAGLTQFLSAKLQPQAATPQEGQMASTMKTMVYTMPLFSVFMGFTLPAGVGLFWAISAAVRCIQQLVINHFLKKIPEEVMIEQSRLKAQKKREKKGVQGDKLNRMATTSTRNVEEKKPNSKFAAYVEKANQMNQQREQAKAGSQASQSSSTTSTIPTNATPGSLASKANMVSRFNSGATTEEVEVEQVITDTSKKKSSKKNK